MSKNQKLTQGTNMTNNSLQGNNMIKQPSVFTNEKKCFDLLFENNNYPRMIKPSLSLLGNLLTNPLKFEGLTFTEKQLMKSLYTLSGRICVEIDKELSNNLMNTSLDSIHFDDLNTLPFNCFIINLKQLNGIEKVLIYKTDSRIYFHFDNVHPYGFSIQLVLEKNNRIIPQYTYSSLFHHREVEKISTETHKMIEVCFEYILSVLMYLCCFQKDETKVIKEMSYDNYLSKVSHKNQKKDKFIKKIESKNNIVKLQFVKNKIIYNNSHHTDTKRKVSTMFLVKGHWRDQRIGTRNLHQIKKIWIPPHFRGINNEIYKEKLYMVS
jgi:hypothetical protein